LDAVSLTGALARARQWSLGIQTVIDIGASDGRWTEACHPYFPQADYFLVEAQLAHARSLDALSRRMPRIKYIVAAAGDSQGSIFFDASDLLGGIASHTPIPHSIEVPMTTIDAQVAAHKLQPPFLLKLDTHGFEIPILEGARESLAQTHLIVIEVYNFNFVSHNLRFHEMCLYLEGHGFRCVDLCDVLHRPTDGALWQFDLFFTRAEHPIFRHTQYASVQ
jgi:FkbM family methyltransferase